MKHYFLIILIIGVAFIGSAQTVTLSYDANGNRLTKQVNGLFPVAAITGDTIVCHNNIANLTAHGGGAYLWSNGATDSVISIIMDTSTIYKVVATNSIGCKDSISKLIVALPVPITGPVSGPIHVNLGSPIDTYTVPLHAGAYYNWSVTNGSVVGGSVMGGGFGSNQIIVQWYAPGTGTISVYETVDSGRCTTLPVYIPDTVSGGTLGANNLSQTGCFNVYPNPASSEVWVDYYENKCSSITVSVVNTIGQLMYKNVFAGDAVFHVQLSTEVFTVPGIYTIQLQSPNQFLTKKITVVK